VAGESSRRPEAMLAGLEPGTVLSGYRLESRIGSGGMAVVFRARDELLGRLVALKVLAPALAGGQEFRERFIRESRAAAAVDHPHIIPVYSAGEADDVLYIAMRYVSGGDLRLISARDGALSGERVALLLSPVASALDAAHAAGLVHRDVKPANILVDASPGRPDHPYLSDFGLAKGANAANGLTGTGQYLGTPNFSAPEQIAGKPVDARADQYALACVAYTMLTGQLPFDNGQPMAVMWAHINKPPPSVAAHRADLPAAVDTVLARALAKAPEDRFPSCGEFAEALRGVLGAGSYVSSAGASSAGASSADASPAAPAALPASWTAPPRPVVLGKAAPRTAPFTAVPSGPVPSGAAPSFVPAGPVPPGPVPPGPAPRAWGPAAAPAPAARPPSFPALPAAEVTPPPRAPWASAVTPGLSEQPTGPLAPWTAPDGKTAAPPLPGGWPAPAGPDTAVPADDRAVTWPRAAGRGARRRRTWIIAGAGLVIAAGTAAGVLFALPRTPAPVLQPTGLTAVDESTSAVDISWHSPATGPLPDHYEIFRNGTGIGSVPGDTTSYHASGLDPASVYIFAVKAVRDDRKSPVSAILTTQTATPPLSAAVLDWTGNVSWDMTSLEPADDKMNPQPGSSWQDAWKFTPDPSCTVGPCDATLAGNWENTPFTMHLSGSGLSYSGSTPFSGYFECGSTPVTAALNITLTVKTAGPQGTQWQVQSFDGDAVMDIPATATADETCYADTADMTLSSG
jgi:hypothetical protein